MTMQLEFLVPGGALSGPLISSLVDELNADPLLEDDEPDTAADRQRVGTEIGHYVLTRLIGAGGMGAVYLAQRRDQAFLPAVALKIVRNGPIRRQELERFERERNILAQLEHPSIAKILDGGETADGSPYYAMEYIQGLPITQYASTVIDRVEQRVELLIDVARALAHAHQHLVVHRDIKPSNILVSADGRVKLLDFGIAKIIDETRGSGLTEAPVGPMTRTYAAPEQLRGGKISIATDVYQFGMLMFRMLSGRLPYLASPTDLIAWGQAVGEQEPMTLSRAFVLADSDPATRADAWPEHANRLRIRRRLKGDLDAIARKALAKQPTERYATMTALADDLRAFLDGRPVVARRSGALYHAAKFVTRHRIASGSVGVLFLLLTGTVALAIHNAQNAHLAARQANAAVNFVTQLFEATDPGVNKGAALTANTILDRGEQRARDELADEPAMRGRIQSIIARAYLGLGDYPRAMPVFERALDALRSAPASDTLQLAAALEGAAATAMRSGRVEAALRWLDEIEQKLGTPTADNIDILVNALSDRCQIERDRGRFNEALALAERAFALSRRFDPGAETERTARSLLRLGVTLKDVGRNAEARDHMERALQRFTALYGADDQRTLNVDHNIAWLLIAMGKLDLAERKLDRIMTITLRTFGGRSQRYGRLLYTRAIALKARGNLEASLASFLEVASINAETEGLDAVGRGWTLSNVAAIESTLGQQQAALAHWREVERIWLLNMPPDSPVLIDLRIAMAENYLAHGQADEALATVDRALLTLGGSADPQLRTKLEQMRSAMHRK
ncbi:MAG: serine/threonine protein kinase [Rhodanobacteraceae bacterium]|nr:serine/threonine protein kinase [Rhodanobacteraceae bacterium]